MPQWRNARRREENQEDPRKTQSRDPRMPQGEMPEEGKKTKKTQESPEFDKFTVLSAQRLTMCSQEEFEKHKYEKYRNTMERTPQI